MAAGSTKNPLMMAGGIRPKPWRQGPGMQINRNKEFLDEQLYNF